MGATSKRVTIRTPVRRAVRVVWRGGRGAGWRWADVRRNAPLSAPSWPVSIAIHGVVVAALLQAPMAARAPGSGETRPVVAVDISRLPRPIPPPPPPRLAELPKREFPLPNPLSLPEPPPAEVVAVRFPTNAPATPETEFEVEDLLPDMAVAAAPDPPPPDEANAAAGADRIREAIVRHLAYPESARRRGEEGRVLLILSVADDGGLMSLEGEGDSRILVQAALHAARRAAPFSGVDPAVYRIPIRFRLVDGPARQT